MSEPLWSREMVAQIEVRALPGGGFANREGEAFRPDATAWAVLAMTAHGVGGELQDAARQRLAAAQLADGRVSISPEHPKAFWPTPLAILAWQGSPAHRAAQDPKHSPDIGVGPLGPNGLGSAAGCGRSLDRGLFGQGGQVWRL